MAQRDLINPEDFLNSKSLKDLTLKKLYEEYYQGYPEGLLTVAGNPDNFASFKESYFQKKFLKRLALEYAQTKN